MSDEKLQQAYEYCQQMATRHYENFPVASILLPKALRRPVTVIYAFARSADDFADEGEYSTAQRLALLEQYDSSLQQIARGETPEDPVCIALAAVISQHALPLVLFSDLLSAFKQDVSTHHYPDFDAVMDYCRRSANPVGRLLLHLYQQATPQKLALSDQVCSALQLINFLQDIQQDHREHGRIYLPQDEMHQFGVSEQDIREACSSRAVQRLIEAQIRRARSLMLAGAPLGRLLPGRAGLELRLIIQGGLRILERLEQHDGQVYRRPRLTRGDKLRMLWRAILRR